ncbi:MAG: hypothetical protein ABH854_01360 [Candidatus Diapherotrites archaeon]
MKVKCPDCKELFELDINEHDEGDAVECPECYIECTVVVRGGKLALRSEKEKYFDNEDEFYDESDYE